MKWWSLFGIIAVLFIVGCSSGGTSVVTTNFKQGVAEVSLEQVQNSPPREVFPESLFSMIVAVHNEAAYAVSDLRLEVLGIDQTYFDLYPSVEDIGVLQGRSLTNPIGDKTFIQFDGVSGDLVDGAQQYINPYFLQLSYRSQVQFADTICLSSTLYEFDDGGCQVQSQKSYSGQGAPLAVTKMDTVVSPGVGAEFRLHLQNRGRGDVETVRLGNVQLGGEPVECAIQSTDNPFAAAVWDSEQREMIVICRTDSLTTTTSYTTTLTADFLYTYKLQEQYQLRLVR